MRVFIITEGGKDIGLGHITRCTSLYDEFAKRGIAPIFVVNTDLAKSLLGKRRAEVFNWLKYERRLLGLIFGADIVIIDSYLAPAALYKEVSRLVDVPVYLDDNKRLAYPNGIVINGAIYAEKMRYPAQNGLSYLLGSTYTLLRKEFWRDTDKKIRGKVKSVMIVFGGDDIRGMTPKIIALLSRKYPKLIKNIAIGAAFTKTNIQAIENIKDEKINLVYRPNAKRMLGLMIASDVAVSAGGQTLYELARVGVPTIGISVASNQALNIKGWAKTGFLIFAGKYEQKSLLKNVGSGLKSLQRKDRRRMMSATGRKYMDGKGAARVVKALLNKRFADTFSMRTADRKDARNLFKLTNDKVVRAQSFTPRSIAWDNHIKWFKERLGDANCVFLIGENNGKFCGQVRFDIDKKGKSAAINISVGKNIRGRGLAPFIINKSMDLLADNKPGIQKVTAHIKENNMSSRISFERAGFKFLRDSKKNGNKIKVLTKRVSA